MKLIYYKGDTPNFGDELNHWLWPRLLPDFFDDNDGAVFIGIGSIIGERNFKPETLKLVVGAGFVPEYHEKPDVSDKNWRFYGVRGPRTAKLLGLNEEIAIGDPAILINQFVKPYKDEERSAISFMPHWESIEKGNWEEVCRAAGIGFINPCTDDIENVMEQINRSKLLITEAMHGAIVADALRVPWVPVLPINKAHRNKWLDWSATLNLTLTIQKLYPSDLKEARLSVFRKLIATEFLSDATKPLFKFFAVQRLKKLSHMPIHLSDQAKSDEVTQRMLEIIEQIKKDFSG